MNVNYRQLTVNYPGLSVAIHNNCRSVFFLIFESSSQYVKVLSEIPALISDRKNTTTFEKVRHYFST